MTQFRPVPASAVARMTPPGTGGREAAIIDIAQDILLAHLSDEGLFDDLLVFKGGTALRKMYAGSGGRFSTDLDFGLASMEDERHEVADVLAETIDGYSAGGVAFSVAQDGAKWEVRYRTSLGDVSALSTKLDVGPPVWLPPRDMAWVPTKAHDHYVLPDSLPVMALEENLAEKIARMNRTAKARDLYDLWWISNHPPHSQFDRAVVRDLAALKCWVDTHGLHADDNEWLTVPQARVFDPEHVMSVGSNRIQDESIGLLASPPPDLEELANSVVRLYGFLADPLSEPLATAVGSGQSGRAAVLSLLRDLPGARFTEVGALY